MVVTDLNEAIDAVRRSGLRLTSARRLVLEALLAARGPISAEDIADGLGGRMTQSDIASVYRNLETLGGLGLVRHFHAGHGPGRYVLESLADQEYLACESCGRVEVGRSGVARRRAGVGARADRLRGALLALPDRRPVPGVRGQAQGQRHVLTSRPLPG